MSCCPSLQLQFRLQPHLVHPLPQAQMFRCFHEGPATPFCTSCRGPAAAPAACTVSHLACHQPKRTHACSQDVNTPRYCMVVGPGTPRTWYRWLATAFPSHCFPHQHHRAKPHTAMPELSLQELLWTVAAARILCGPHICPCLKMSEGVGPHRRLC
jgi:hypothetical protein